MNQELMDACEFAKFAADMTIPLEAKPTPEAGSEVVEGMVDASTYQPQSVGAQTYAGAADAAALAKAKEYAACAAQVPAAAAVEAQKTASAYEEGFSAGYDFAMEKVAGTAAKNAMNFVKKQMSSGKGAAGKVMDAAKRIIPGRQSMASRAGANIAAGGAAALAALGIRNNSAAARVKRFLATNKGKAIMAGGAGAAAMGGAAYAMNKKASLEDAYLAGYQYALEKEAGALAPLNNIIEAEIVANPNKVTKALEFLKGNKKAVAAGAAGLGAAGLLAKKMLGKKTTAQKALEFAKKHKVGLGAGAAAGALGGAYAASKSC